MQKPSKVAALSELRDARHKLSNFRRADFSKDIEKSASQQAIKDFLESNLTKAGFDSDKFGALIKWSDAEARLRIANLRAEADRQSPAVLDTFHRTVENLNDRLKHLKALAPPDASTQRFLLDTATEISATSGITLDSTHIGPGPENNWAKFSYSARVGEDSLPFGDPFSIPGGEVVSFGFLWQNPNDRYAVVNVNGYIVLNGFCSAFSEGGLSSNSVSFVSVIASLFIHELWNEPPTSPVEQFGQSQRALDLSAESAGILQDSHIDARPLFRGFDLGYSQFIMPPKGRAMFEVACSLSWLMKDGGQSGYDFSTSGRQVLSPGVLIGVLP